MIVPAPCAIGHKGRTNHGNPVILWSMVETANEQGSYTDDPPRP